jgi:THO complex subunit 5
MPSAVTDMETSDIVTDPYLQSVLGTSIQTRQQCMNLIELSEGTAVAASQTPFLEDQLGLSKQQKLLYSYLSQLRGLNRNAIIKVRNTKQTTAEARQEIDRLHLQLQNLYYEERHLRGEIAACESYE